MKNNKGLVDEAPERSDSSCGRSQLDKARWEYGITVESDVQQIKFFNEISS